MRQLRGKGRRGEESDRLHCTLSLRQLYTGLTQAALETLTGNLIYQRFFDIYCVSFLRQALLS